MPTMNGYYLKGAFDDKNSPNKMSISSLSRWDSPNEPGKRPAGIPLKNDNVCYFNLHLALCNASGNLLQYIRTPGIVCYKDSVIHDKNPTYVKSTNKDKKLAVTFNDNTVKEIKNSGQKLTTTNYKTNYNTIILTKDYLSNLNTGRHELKISVWPCGEHDLDPSVTVPEYTTTPHVANFNNLNSEYTYGDTISLNGDNENGNVSYESSNTNVATVDENGQITMVGVGNFIITATIPADENYEELKVQSPEIKVHPKRLTIDNIKIKDKLYDGTNKAEFDGTHTLKGIVDGDDVKLKNDILTFSKTSVEKNIPINFTEFSFQSIR